MTFVPPPIVAVDRGLEVELRGKLDGKAKPPGSLGRIEDLAVRLGLIDNSLSPRAATTALVVFAGDHGLTEEGVSSYPSSVTVAMVGLFLAGRSSVSAFAKATGVSVKVVDAGVAAALPAHPGLIDAKIRLGARNAAREPALTPDEAALALTRGIEIAGRALETADVLAIGEMGIGNSSAAALVMHRLAPAPLEACVGLGTGHDEAGLARKTAAIARAAARSDASEPFAVLAEFGGCEIAMMAGAVLGAAARRRPVLVDGFIATAAALAAVRLVPEALDYCIFAHGSAEKGHGAMLAALGVEPLLDLGLRLGEGTGAALAAPLLAAAANLLTEVADLADVLG
ncbi:nicotinate-nucleotide--dimethylbenzimidazole phosphoribosyltransferase [Caulobacter hibisci]|uniref:Nicotinate-nucleotide--dimethylbenzimidazole phosphoribosyltransferase n=1 Tax=Caulobacter hibisci TaxID=2035993 RepID=A0ABS0STH9_9CAUL|nr:nicotinate-nucleotide--dimethylbenzimidazole phosphoribosyltransferase [Caulobacter hibisci]MBI1682939.1 nicotinate-nucleotide--dimethylbenzimidazole phosphoribosyltransferase [Caulobacter hibisci]